MNTDTLRKLAAYIGAKCEYTKRAISYSGEFGFDELSLLQFNPPSDFKVHLRTIDSITEGELADIYDEFIDKVSDFTAKFSYSAESKASIVSSYLNGGRQLYLDQANILLNICRNHFILVDDIPLELVKIIN